jgi:A/G-specific adenine glycosylase
MLSGTEIQQLREDLLGWFEVHQRDLKWRQTRDPYAVWISEVMLQQTRVATVAPYYERFLARFPNLHALAEAPESELLAQWAGLGYYHRARNLQRAAQMMRSMGCFPTTFEEIRRLPGIGDYTAAAVASISFDLPHAVLDGNVFRVLSRIFDDAMNIASGAGRKHFAALAEKILDRGAPGAFNQAVMELGATVCLPSNPQCLVCPISTFCRARQSGQQNDLPVKITARMSVREKRIVFWIEREGKLLAWQRPPTSRLMAGFWELPEPTQLPEIAAGRQIGSFRHGITFHTYIFDVHEAHQPCDIGQCQWISLQDLPTLPVSTILRKAKRVAAQARNSAETPQTAVTSASE